MRCTNGCAGAANGYRRGNLPAIRTGSTLKEKHMRIARKLFLLALVAVAAMAFAASTASAQGIEVLHEDAPGQPHCGDGITQEGCLIHAEGEILLGGHVFGIEATVSNCHVEMEAHIEGDGGISVESVVLTDHPGVDDCVRQPCQLPWLGNGEEDDPEGSGEVVHAIFCIEPVGGGTDQVCDVEVPLATTGDHQYHLLFDDLPGTGTPPCELGGSGVNRDELRIENAGEDQHEDIEIVH
jgi:hypothetical protein